LQRKCDGVEHGNAISNAAATKAELAKLNDHIVDDIIRRHTGCTCLSGTIAVVFDNEELQNTVTVEL
jgi:hypothetical protein